MARTQTMVQLTDDLVDELDRLAAGRRMSRSALIRAAVMAYLAEARAVDVGQRIVAGYRKVPPSTPDRWGAASALGDSGTRELLERLDAEEQAAGHDPW